MNVTGGVDGSLERQYGTPDRLERRSAFWAPPAEGESPHARIIAELRQRGARNVLEVGAGTGQFAATVAAEAGIHVVATDASPGMVRAGAERGVESRQADVRSSRSKTAHSTRYWPCGCCTTCRISTGR